ncbi:hypothetical protein SX4_1430 [Vibrio mimicus SX-4]|nr:hypothetical protein SX4_1430 [Vibrio mimicus SX-4]
MMEKIITHIDIEQLSLKHVDYVFESVQNLKQIHSSNT